MLNMIQDNISVRGWSQQTQLLILTIVYIMDQTIHTQGLVMGKTFHMFHLLGMETVLEILSVPLLAIL